ncbi:hypothetical protein FRB99_007666 [Tulasnella sp. 403]|nr:hypothetical protein FRB99_007666 [Tulasnella sp. 403]
MCASAMHSVLTLPDILLAIFMELPPSSLRNAALVCRCWASRASDVLWETSLISLERLLGLLGSLATAMEDQTPCTVLDHPAGPFDPQDVERFNYYRHILTRLEVTHPLWPNTFEVVRSVADLPLCPRLCELSLNMDRSMHAMDSLDSFINPSHLTSIHLRFSEPGSEQQPSTLRRTHTMWEGISNRGSNRIQELKLTYAPSLPDLRFFPNLRCLNLKFGPPIPYEMWAQLESCQLLHSLSLSAIRVSADLATGSASGANAITLVSLRDCTVSNRYMLEDMLQLGVRMPNLRKLAFGHLSAQGESFASVANHSPLIEDMRISYGLLPLTFDSIRHFKEYKNLRSITCETERQTRFGITITEAQIDAFSRSVPNLETFSITAPYIDRARFGMTTHCDISLGPVTLITLATNCRKLKRLNTVLCVSTHDFDINNVTPFASLETLHFTFLCIKDDQTAPFTNLVSQLCSNRVDFTVSFACQHGDIRLSKAQGLDRAAKIGQLYKAMTTRPDYISDSQDFVPPPVSQCPVPLWPGASF